MTIELSAAQFHTHNLNPHHWFLFQALRIERLSALRTWCERTCDEDWFAILTDDHKCIFYIRELTDAIAFRVCHQVVSYLGYETIKTEAT